MVPIFVDLSNRLCLVVGGGAVGRRKARMLLDSGARVRLVCPEARPADFASANLDWITAPYDPAHLNGAVLAFTAATPPVNRQVVADAQARGIWVNAASDPEQGDFFVPACLRRGDLTVAVSSGGRAPAAAATVRDWLASQLDESFAQWLACIAELRQDILTRCADDERRQTLLEQLCSEAWLSRWRHGQSAEVRQAMRALVQELG